MEVKRKVLYSVIALSAVALFGCGDDDHDPVPVATLSVPTTYTFDSHFSPGTDSVSKSGQAARQVLIADLNTEIKTGLAGRITADATTVDSRVEVLAILNAFYSVGTAGAKGGENIVLATTPATKQTTYADINAAKSLQQKIAGNDAVTDHKDWDGGGFVGWTTTSPDALITSWLTDIADNTKDLALTGVARTAPVSGEDLKVYQTTDGLDLRELVQKFLLGAITFSQGTDDYLDDATPNKGLRSNNVDKHDGTDPFTALEHGFDEGFGYFGAARDYNDYTDVEKKGSGGRADYASGYHDTNGDGAIDLIFEFNFGNSTNAAKRDVGSTTGTDFTKTIFDAFLRGRAIINNAAGRDLTADEMTALKAQRDIIVLNWEKAIAATIVHYLNNLEADMGKFGTAAYSYSSHIGHWGEMKGFALGLQFNPRSPLNTGTLFADFHLLVGEAPVLPTEPNNQIIADYKKALMDARAILAAAYNFDDADVAGW